MTTAESDDDTLMRRAAAGEREAFVTLVRRHARRGAGYAHSIVRDWNAAQDVMQQTFLHLYAQRAKFGQESNFNTWLFVNLRQQAIAWLRQHRRLRAISDEEMYFLADASTDPMEAMIAEESRLALHRRLRALPLHYQEALYLHYFQGMPVREVATILQRSEKAVEQYILLAKRKLRDS